jgi:hypothetical protein
LTAINSGSRYFRYPWPAADQPTPFVGGRPNTGEDHATATSRGHARARTFRSGGFAIAQTAPGSTGAQEKFNLSQPHEQMITQGLRSEASQAAPGYQGDAGSKVPDSMTSKALPDDVTAQVPATKTYLFVKLPDRILLIDPDTKLVAEIVGGPATTGRPSDASPTSPGSAPR